MNDKVGITSVLGVMYHHYKTDDGGDLYLTKFGEPYKKLLGIESWYEERWFASKKQKLLGTSSVYKLPTKTIDGRSLNLVVKYSRVGEDVPFNTHTLEQYCNAEFNSPWEEFALVMEIFDARPVDATVALNTQQPMAIYVPSETMQLWQSGRSRHRISKIRARHPGIDLDILKQYILVYGWIEGKNLIEMFECMDIELYEAVEDLKELDAKAARSLAARGYYVADMKPEHVIIREEDVRRIDRMSGPEGAWELQVKALHDIIDSNRHSVIDYELLARTPEHDERIRSQRRRSYLDDQRNRFNVVHGYEGLLSTQVMGVPYIFGHVESTGGKLWVIGNNARLFDYFLPERWRKTNALSMSEANEVYYTVTKDNIHVVWKTSRVGELSGSTAGDNPRINSPFEEAAIAFELQSLGMSTVYFRAIYVTGTKKLEASPDMRSFESHKHLLDPEGHGILDSEYNYISIRGYYNGTDEWVSEGKGALYTPVDLEKAVAKGIIDGPRRDAILEATVSRLHAKGFDGTMLKANDILLAIDDQGGIYSRTAGQPEPIICNLEFVSKIPG